MKPNYRVMPGLTNEILYVIMDIGPWDRHPTVTNRAEEVHAELATVRDGRILACIDSEGELDRLLPARSGGIRFAPCSEDWLGPLTAEASAYAQVWRRLSQARAKLSLAAERQRDLLEQRWSELRPEERKMFIDLECKPPKD